MEDHRNDFVLILAGYPNEIDFFLSSNPGLPSRFPITVHFPDYTADELLQISDLMLKERDYEMLPQTKLKLRHYLSKEKRQSRQSFSNARYVRNLIEKSIRNQAVRLVKLDMPTREDLMRIYPEDLIIDQTEDSDRLN